MTWRMHLLILIVLALVSSRHAKEETKKALIIAVDELKPEESDAIISDLTIKDQRTSSTYQRDERSPINKQLDYIIVHPEDLKTLKNLEGVTVEQPKLVRYPEPSSDESYEVSRYSPYSHSEKPYSVNSGYPESPSENSKHGVVKYPSRPAPPLSTYSGGDSSNEEHISQDSPYIHKSYPAYNSPDSTLYQTAVPSDVSDDHGYSSSKPTSYSGHSSYSAPDSSYGSSKPSTYSGTSSYNAPSNSYGSSKSSSYSSPSNYRKSKPNSYSSSPYYESSHPSSYSGPTTYSGPSSYGSSKPSSYSGPSSYGSSKPSSYSGPSSYGSSKPSSYSGPSAYESPKQTTYSGPSNYETSKPNSYSGASSYPEPENGYSKSKPSSYSSYSGTSYPPSKLSSYSEPSSPHYDSSSEKTHPDSEKYNSSPETHDHPEKTYSYDDYNPPKSVSHGYESDLHYTPASKPYKSGYYDSPTAGRVKHVLYDDLPSPYKSSPPTNVYDSPHTEYNDDSPIDSPKSTYSSSSKPSSHGTYYHNSPTKKKYISPSSHDKESKYTSHHDTSFRPSYGKKLYGISLSPMSYKPRSTYNSNPYSDHYHGSPVPVRSYPRKHSYDSLKTSYETLHDPSSYEEPVKSYNVYRYPSYRGTSKVTYDSPSSYSDHHPRSSFSDLKQNSARPQYEDTTISKPKTESEYSSYNSPTPVSDVKYKSSPVSTTKYEDPSYNDRGIAANNYGSPSTYKAHSNLEYGSRYPSSYRKTRHTDSKISNPPTSKFTIEDARSPDDVHQYEVKKPNSGSTESHSHYHHYDDDSSEIPDHHSAKKNYSPVRPAPLHDELVQPRYPPLPRRSKNKGGKHYDSEEDQSKEKTENYKPDPSYTETKTYSPESYNDDYNRDSYTPSYSNGKTESRYPTSAENNNYHYSDHSSEESDDEPPVYTKTVTTTYTKPYKDSSAEHAYSSDNPTKKSYKAQPTDYPRKNRYISNGKDFVPSQPEYSRPVYRDSQRSPGRYPNSYSPTNSRTYTANTSLPISYSSLSEILPPKRVEGVVYRSRQSYPHVKPFRKQKGYLPYKPYYPKSTSAYDHRPYEGVPSEIREKNVTRDLSVFDLPEKTSKSTKLPLKKQLRYSSTESNGQSDDSNENSNDAIPGEPGKDYPVLKEIPYTHFSCDNKLPGFYADVENRCQVYYQCNEEGRLQSFLCPNGTIFNQLTFVCEWWHNVDCSKSEKYFAKNNQLYKLPRRVPTSPKSKRTVNSNFERSQSENGGSHRHPSYYTADSEEFRVINNGRMRRSNVRYAATDM